MSEEQLIRHEHHNIPKDPEIKVEVTRGQKGTYGWTISYSGTDSLEVIDLVSKVDQQLRKRFLE